MREIEVALPDLTMRLRTDAGVFSPDGLDTGTRILLSEVADDGSASPVLDLGCGYGPIAVALARRSPDRAVWAVDVNERALELCGANSALNGVSVQVSTPSAVPDDLRFAAMWSNPPIRIGKAALHELLSTWLARVDGPTYLVVQKHLGSDSLATWLGGEGYAVRRLASRRGYRVLEVTS